jgi:hypothetical protein
VTDPEERGPEYVEGPKGVDRFDLAGWLPEARKLARSQYDDAELVMMYASGVGADGKVDLTRRGHGGYMFRSPRRSAPERRCYYRLEMRGSKIEVGPILPATTADPCAWPIAPAPRCSVKQIWQEAIQLGADPKGQAYIRYLLKKGKPTWEFTVLGGGQDFLFGDDC